MAFYGRIRADPDRNTNEKKKLKFVLSWQYLFPVGVDSKYQKTSGKEKFLCSLYLRFVVNEDY